MKNRLITLILSTCIIASGFSFAFADTESGNNFTKDYYSDYSTISTIEDKTFNPAEFTLSLAIQSAKWLGITSERSGSVIIKTDADNIDLSQYMPNLDKLAIAEELAMTSMAGNTFACKNLPVEWVGGVGQWQTAFNDPTGRIRTALDSLGGYINGSKPSKRGDDEIGPWFDSYLFIPQGTSLEYGPTRIQFEKNCEIDELYDAVQQQDQYASTFAENVYKIQSSTQSIDASGDSISIFIPAGAFLQFAESRFTVVKDLTITIQNAVIEDADPVSEVLSALDTAKKTSTRYYDSNNKRVNSHGDLYSDAGDNHPSREYFIHTCDVNAVFESGFKLLNEFIGVFAQKDARIEIVSGGEFPENSDDVSEIDPDAALCAQFMVTSVEEPEQVCAHGNTKVVDKIAPTFTTLGYTGDVICADCGKLLKEGTIIPKKPSSIKLNATSVKLKVKQSSSALKVSFEPGDSIKSVTSSKTSIVQATKSGADKIKLKAGKKTGTAKVTVTLASGKSAVVTVKVQKKAVACTGIKVESGTSVSLKKGKTHQIKAVRAPITCVQKITYKSSNKKVATVTSKGKVKAKKKGKATITVKCGKKTKKIKIKVK